MSVLFDHIGELLTGLLVTLELAVLAFPLALLIGTVLGVCRVGPIGPLRAVAGFYVQCLRNSPLLLVLVMVVFGLPYVGATVPLFGSVVLGLGCTSARTSAKRSARVSRPSPPGRSKRPARSG